MTIRAARESDLQAVVDMLADDPLGATRESPTELDRYLPAFRAIEADPHQHLAVVEIDGRVAGCLQLTVIPGLSRTGMTRGLIEAVRVHRDHRGSGVGSRLVEWALDRARREGCGIVQLTTDLTRHDAHRFYERLGFVRSHYGMKHPL
ncbi:N-acetylglutamate synthase-like GNAT family acetyltransferase [Stackebrandtia albiflava]|uniref:N-acetylglutamate synthase-like GNAT family acetyltransferase n=2 Tax=Stackebrandtia albiflava TaxID=406432 RepID=A0A562V9W9_9ACTN|nr:GNAT family N-acetyltransferase [Stackebrandtia albiflava]TWJ14641.1 N-acetylglutamate synthase-like GNAT family acetyltransferase [Stackebrandtia albiflava]